MTKLGVTTVRVTAVRNDLTLRLELKPWSPVQFDFKNGKTYFESLISPSFDVLHCSTIVHMNHMEHMFKNLPFLLLQEGPKKPQ